MGFMQFFYHNVTLNLVDGGFTFGMSWAMVAGILAVIFAWRYLKRKLKNSSAKS